MNGKRIKNHYNDVVVFASSSAVGLIVQDNAKALKAEEDGSSAAFTLGAGPFPGSFEGGFYTPEEAREIAKALNAYADEAETNIRNAPTPLAASALKAFLAKRRNVSATLEVGITDEEANSLAQAAMVAGALAGNDAITIGTALVRRGRDIGVCIDQPVETAHAVLTGLGFPEACRSDLLPSPPAGMEEQFGGEIPDFLKESFE